MACYRENLYLYLFISSEAELPVSGLSGHLGLRLLSGRQFVLLNCSYLFLKKCFIPRLFLVVQYCVTTFMLEWQKKVLYQVNPGFVSLYVTGLYLVGSQ